ncbi:nuclear pore complex protein Nup154 [Ostrinia nubilalis]|uniref:nuclear pore complex protein Nup154 n=1 Tax=Ostrinia nubilalis TaxID=29057 RepID=UPI0030826410
MMPSIVSSSVDVPRPSDGSKMQLECLELAGCTLDRYISSDNSRPSFLEITGIAAQRSPTCSGLNAGDYRNLEVLLNHPNLSQLKILNKVPLPPEIMEHFAHMQCHCLMGVFPEISRVWLAIDSNIYVWAFEHGCDVAYFDGLGETIVSVGLVKPKPGVFQSFVKYLLVLTTTVEIVVLGVTFSSSKNDGSSEFQEIHLVPEPVFVLPTDGVSMMSVKSTAKGRIFMGGKDGCLYEITYQAQLGWFGKHCKKVNHSTSALSFLVPSFLNAALYDEDPIVKIEVDNSRNILYTLSEKGCIEVFDLGADGEGLSRVVRFTQGKILTSALDIVKTLEPINFKPVVAISAVEESESEHLNLVAVTQTGARLYFSTGSGDANQGGSQRPQYLTLLHVRLPPGFTPNASVLRPKQVHSAVHENGCLVMVCSTGNGAEAETLWCLSRVLPGPGFSEAHSLLALDGPAWALTALPAPRAAHLSPAMVARKAGKRRNYTNVAVLPGPGFSEAHSLLALDGPAWALTALPAPRAAHLSPAMVARKARKRRNYTNLAVLPGPGFSEAHSLLALDGPAWALTALPAPRAAHLSPAMVARKEVWSVSRWAVVTGAGAAVLAAGAAPDLLRSLLRDCRGPEAHAVKDFFQLHSVEQACACAVYLACEDATSNDLSVSEWAARAFFLYGAQLAPAPLLPHQTSQLPSSIGSPKFSPRQMSTPMSMRGPQGQMQPGKLNQSYQQAAMNQSFPGSPNQSMMPQSPFQQNMMSPTPFNQSSFVGNVTQQQRDQNFPIQVEYSAKHNGLYIYIGRILAPIWNLKCVSKSLTPDNKEFMSSNVTGEDCAFTVQKLQRAAAFAQRVVAPPHSDEHASLQALKMFITMAIEMLSLWKVLCEHQFHVIASSLPPEQQSALQAASFRELLVGGQEVACLLLGSLVAGYLRDNASVDGISQKLRQLCPTLYRKEDATCSKANELLMFAKQQKNPTEREEMLQHALKLCMDVAPNVNLPLVCAKLVSAGFYSGVVQLCRACAARLDPHDKALHHYSSDQPAQDREGHLAYYRRYIDKALHHYSSDQPAQDREGHLAYYRRYINKALHHYSSDQPAQDREGHLAYYRRYIDKDLHHYSSDQPAQDREGHLAYYRRMDIYREVCNALERLYERSVETGSEPAPLRSQSQSTTDTMMTLSPADANYQGRKLVWECLACDDELLHVAVYQWLVSKNLGAELLSLGSAPPASLRRYLAAGARAASPQAALQLLDLLWKVLEKCGDHLAAAHVLEGLATKPGSGALLSQRISWLSAGVVCVRGAGAGGPGGGELLRRLEEAGEVARVQAAVRAAAAALPRPLQPPPHAMHRLDDELLEVTQAAVRAAAAALPRPLQPPPHAMHRLDDELLEVTQAAVRAAAAALPRPLQPPPHAMHRLDDELLEVTQAAVRAAAAALPRPLQPPPHAMHRLDDELLEVTQAAVRAAAAALPRPLQPPPHAMHRLDDELLEVTQAAVRAAAAALPRPLQPPPHAMHRLDDELLEVTQAAVRAAAAALPRPLQPPPHAMHRLDDELLEVTQAAVRAAAAALPRPLQPPPHAMHRLDDELLEVTQAAVRAAAAALPRPLQPPPHAMHRLDDELLEVTQAAVRAAAAALPRPLQPPPHAMHRLDDELLEVTQAAVRAAAAALPRPLQPPPHAMHRLDDELLEVTQLYEEYADRYNLWECKLAIVQCSGHNDALLVENIWSNILAEAEAAARGCLTADEKLGSVLSKLTTLGREYVHTGHCFPLYFIVRQLEIMSCKLQADQSMVFKAVLNIGVSLEQVLDIYIKLVSVNERVWLGCGDETHVCSVAALLLESARGELAPLEAAARRRALARCKDLHEAALSSLQVCTGRLRAEPRVCSVAALLLESARGELAPLEAAARRRALARCKDLHEAALSSLQVCTGRLRAEPRVCSVAALLLESARGELAPLEAAARRRALARCKDLHEAALSSLQVCTGRLRAEPRVCSVAALLLESARGELAPLEAAARRRALARCKDLHEAALSSLQARPNTQRLMDRLTVAQAHLDRLD